MPVPQTLTSGLAALLTMYSAKDRQVFNAPSPAPEPRTGCHLDASATDLNL